MVIYDGGYAPDMQNRIWLTQNSTTDDITEHNVDGSKAIQASTGKLYVKDAEGWQEVASD